MERMEDRFEKVLGSEHHKVLQEAVTPKRPQWDRKAQLLSEHHSQNEDRVLHLVTCQDVQVPAQDLRQLDGPGAAMSTFSGRTVPGMLRNSGREEGDYSGPSSGRKGQSRPRHGDDETESSREVTRCRGHIFNN